MTSILKVSEIQDPTNSNTALTIDSSGLLLPKIPVFEVIKTTNQTLSSGTFTKITFDSESYDTASF